jgi:hypothetical protein
MTEQVETMVDDDEKSSSLSAIILVAIIIFVAFYCTTFGLQTLQWIDAHRWASVNPWLKDVPQPIPAAAPANTPAPVSAVTQAASPNSKALRLNTQAKPGELTAYLFEFTAPWPAKSKESASAGGAEFRFDSGQVIVFGDPEAQLDTLHILRESTAAEYEPFQNLVSESGISSNYALYQAVYNASPSQFGPLMAYATAQRNRILLLTKLSFGFDLEKNIYSFTMGDKRGFQFGDPAKGEPVALRVFNARDKQFRFIFTVAAGSGAQITQSDVNEVIESLQPEPYETR